MLHFMLDFSNSRRKLLLAASTLSVFGVALTIPYMTRPSVSAPLTGEFFRVHDPSRITYCDGKYYVYHTGDLIPMRYSSDMIHWENGPAVLDKIPDWIQKLVPTAKGKSVWAPDIIKVHDEYWLFYSYSTFGSQVSAIGLLSSPTLDPQNPDYKWTDRGLVIATDGTGEVNAIDAAPIFGQNGDLWVSYGSWNRNGIQIVKLDNLTGKPVNKPVTITAGQPIGPEAPYLHYRDGYYYLFENEGYCCRGMNSTYRVMVGRSKNIGGPYLDKDGKDLAKGGGSVFLDSSGEMIGPGHIGILSQAGVDYMTFHFYNGRANGTPTMALRTMTWDEKGWPIATPDLAGGHYAIISKASGLALSVHDRNPNDGTPLDQFKYNGDIMQQWNVVPIGDGYYGIASLGTGKYVDLFEGNPADGTKINQQGWLKNDFQRWQIEAVGNGEYRIVNKGGKSAITLPSGNKAPRTLIQGESWKNTDNQKWIFRPLP